MFRSLRFFNQDYSSLAKLIFVSCLSLILVQKISFLQDRPFLYDLLKDIPSAEGTRSQALLYLFAIIRTTEIQSFFLFGEILLLLRCILLPPGFLTFSLLFLISNLTFRGSYYLQDGGSNLSHILLFYCYLYVIGERFFSQSESERQICFRLMIGLARFQMAFLYAVAFYSKSQGVLWQNGDALYYILQNDYFTNPLARDLVLSFPILSKISTYPVFLFQFTFPLLIWFKPARTPLVGIGVGFHLMIGFVMNIWLFSVSMIIFYIVFLDANEAQNFLRKIQNRLAFLRTSILTRTTSEVSL